MPTSQFCIQQRRQEQQQVRKLLWVGLACSIALHGILAAVLPRQLRTKAPQVKKPMELILVDKPKPKPKLEETPIVPKPKPESPQQKAPEPKPETPEPKPEPPQQKAPEPKPEPPKPLEPKPELKPEIPQQKVPTPKKILTSNLPPISQAPVAPQPQRAIAPPPVKNSPIVKKSSSNVATNSPPPTTESESIESASEEEGIACVSNCEPEYPDALEGAEGSAGVKLTIDPKGNVISAELASADSNSQVNRQALLAARQMEFSSPPGGNAASVQVKIDFTVEGSDYDRTRREEQERKEQAAKERQKQETARQQQLKQERQAQRAQLERERQARQQQQQFIPNTQPGSKPLPALDQSELEAEKLRKFRERIENY